MFHVTTWTRSELKVWHVMFNFYSVTLYHHISHMYRHKYQNEEHEIFDIQYVHYKLYTVWTRDYYQTYLFEKFHFSLFLFFAFMTIHAGSHGYWYWVLILTISNLLYNVYPNLLQQYIRVKLESAKQVKKIPWMKCINKRLQPPVVFAMPAEGYGHFLFHPG